MIIFVEPCTDSSKAVNEVLTLAEATLTPVFSSPKFSTKIPYGNPFRAGSAMQLSKIAATSPPDFILILGARTGFLLGGRSGAVIPNQGCKIVQVDLDGSEIGRSHHIDLGIVSDASLAVQVMNAAVAMEPFKTSEEWIRVALSLKTVRSSHNEQEPVIIKENGRLHPYHAIKKVFQCLPRGSTVCIDGGEAGGWALQNLNEAGACLSMVTTGYLGFLGNGFGYSLGAAIADPSKLILNIQGDGSVGFHIGELDTYSKFNLKIITLVVNNSLWGMSAAGQEIIYGRITSKRPCAAMNPKTRYDIVAQGFGCNGIRVDAKQMRRHSGFEGESLAYRSLSAIEDAMEELVRGDGPGLLDLIVSDVPYQDGTKAMVGLTDDPDVIVVPYYDNLPRPYFKNKQEA